MVGPWEGSLGNQRVVEAWSPAFGGSMSTMVRLSGEAGVDVIELIEIREQDGTLHLHLRQFRSSLDLYHTGDFSLDSCDASGVRFVDPGSRIESLSYLRLGEEGMQVAVGITGGMVVTADLHRPS